MPKTLLGRGGPIYPYVVPIYPYTSPYNPFEGTLLFAEPQIKRSHFHCRPPHTTRATSSVNKLELRSYLKNQMSQVLPIRVLSFTVPQGSLRAPCFTKGAAFREFFCGPLGFVPLGFGSLNHGIWPSIRVFGTQDLGVQTLRVQT